MNVIVSLLSTNSVPTLLNEMLQIYHIKGNNMLSNVDAFLLRNEQIKTQFKKKKNRQCCF